VEQSICWFVVQDLAKPGKKERESAEFLEEYWHSLAFPSINHSSNRLDISRSDGSDRYDRKSLVEAVALASGDMIAFCTRNIPS